MKELTRGERLKNKLRFLRDLFSASTDRRYVARHHILSRIAKLMDTRVYDPYVTWFKEQSYREIWEGTPWLADAMDVRKFVLYNLLKLARSVEGDTAECGAYEGASSFVILKAIEGTGKTHHVFDSFEGLSSPVAKDLVKDKKVINWRKNDLFVDDCAVRTNLGNFGNVIIYKGWIPERFGEVADREFAFVHIDVDLYEPTLESLRYFYPRTTRGALVVCDDYGFASCPGAHRAMEEYAEEIGEEVVHLPTGQGLLFKR